MSDNEANTTRKMSSSSEEGNESKRGQELLKPWDVEAEHLLPTTLGDMQLQVKEAARIFDETDSKAKKIVKGVASAPGALDYDKVLGDISELDKDVNKAQKDLMPKHAVQLTAGNLRKLRRIMWYNWGYVFDVRRSAFQGRIYDQFLHFLAMLVALRNYGPWLLLGHVNDTPERMLDNSGKQMKVEVPDLKARGALVWANQTDNMWDYPLNPATEYHYVGHNGWSWFRHESGDLLFGISDDTMEFLEQGELPSDRASSACKVAVYSTSPARLATAVNTMGDFANGSRVQLSSIVMQAFLAAYFRSEGQTNADMDAMIMAAKGNHHLKEAARRMGGDGEVDDDADEDNTEDEFEMRYVSSGATREAHDTHNYIPGIVQQLFQICPRGPAQAMLNPFACSTVNEAIETLQGFHHALTGPREKRARLRARLRRLTVNVQQKKANANKQPDDSEGKASETPLTPSDGPKKRAKRMLRSGRRR